MPNKIAKKVAAILAKAESSTFEGESTVLLAKAQKLMAEHGIDMLSVETANDPMGVEEDFETVTSTWQGRLFTVVANYYGADCAFIRAAGTRTEKITIAGKESARATVKVMWPYVLGAVKREAEAMWAGDFGDKQREYKGFIKTFDDMLAQDNDKYIQKLRDDVKAHIFTKPQIKAQIANALTRRLYREIKARKTVATDTKNALVVVDAASQALNDYYPAGMVETEQKVIPTLDEAAQRAENIGLHEQATQQTETRLLTSEGA